MSDKLSSFSKGNFSLEEFLELGIHSTIFDYFTGLMSAKMGIGAINDTGVVIEDT